MMKIEGKWFDGRTSKSVPAILEISEEGRWLIVQAENNEIIHQEENSPPKISPRLGNTPRYLTFSNDQSFETDNNDAVDIASTLWKQKSWSLKIHLFESRLRYVLLAIVIFIGFAFAGVKYGVPAMANSIAHKIPRSILITASNQTLTVFDKTYFSPSEIDYREEQHARAFLQQAIDQHPSFTIEILFRKGGKIGANAFALPDGRIIITDEMVEHIDKDEELLAIVYHEIGHIVHRHGTRRLIQNSLLAFSLMAITGDTSGVSEIFLGLPVLLTELGYSRAFELEADRYAIEHLKADSISPEHLANILIRITNKEENKNTSDNHGWLHYFSTHPRTQERVQVITESVQ